MPKTDKVGFNLDNSEMTLYSIWLKKHNTKLQIIKQKLVSRLNTCKKWSDKENNIASNLGEWDKICSNYQQMYAVMRNWTSHQIDQVVSAPCMHAP